MTIINININVNINTKNIITKLMDLDIFFSKFSKKKL